MRKTMLAMAGAAVLAGCGSDDPATEAATAGRSGAFSNASSRVDNPWFPLPAGTTWVYRGSKDGQPSRDVVKVLRRPATVNGVRTAVLDDRLYLSGRLRERTTDWYAQDTAGNVWYLGEATAELDARGRVKSTEGSWRAGTAGARAGVYMPAHPRVGQSFAQEHFPGHAEDHFRILSLTSHVRTPTVSSRHALLTREWTPLEPGVVDHKVYVRGFGMVVEQSVAGGSERGVLVSMRRG